MATIFSLNPHLKPHSFSHFKITSNNTNNNHPIAPWNKIPLVIPSNENFEKKKIFRKKPDNSLTEKVSGARGKKAMKEILQGIEKLEKKTLGDEFDENERILEKLEKNEDFDKNEVFIKKMERNEGFDENEVFIKKMERNEGFDENERFFEKMERNEDFDKDDRFLKNMEKNEDFDKNQSFLKKLENNEDFDKNERFLKKMEKTCKSPNGEFDKDESFIAFGERRHFISTSQEKMETMKKNKRKLDIKERKPLVFTPREEPEDTHENSLAMEEIVEGIGKMVKTRKDPFGNVAKNGGFMKFGEKMPWEGEEKSFVIGKIKREKKPTAAKLSLDGELLKRLKGEAAKMRVWVKVNKAGVTRDVVDQVMITWRENELAMMKFDVPLKWNMGRALEIVEIKTGGLVVWTKNDTLVVYRGCNYKLGLEPSLKLHSNFSNGNITRERTTVMNDGHMEAISRQGTLYEREADRLLDGLGPRFLDWWMPKPLPVDGDLLPEVVPGFKPPLRLCPPPRARAKLTDYELTYLRKLARPLPTHFVLGRNRRLQGLAAAILKLWEKCHTVKIAVKWGVMNTSNEEMANQLKDLTGGVLLLRNKFIIIIYRGHDFLPCGVADDVLERELELRECQLEEETARSKAINISNFTDESCVNSSSTGTLSEYLDLRPDRASLYNGYTEVNVQLEAEKERLKKQLKNQERKLSILQMKIRRSLRELAKLSSAWTPTENDTDQEMISEEERECFRKIGLKLDSSLLLGRRGVFKGVIEGIYQHWKHREIAKVITMQRLLSRVVYTAKQLEAETGGILVSVDKLKEGHAIILYRGKNHQRPQNFVSPSLLTKREALSRSLEMQRVGSLKFFAFQRQKAISELKDKLADLEKKRTARREPGRFPLSP